MAFIETVPASQAVGSVRTLYERAQASAGYVPNHTKIFSLRPDVHAAWSALLASVRGHLDARRYELVTLAAARALRSSYCSIAHAKVLRDGLLEPGELEAVAARSEDASLTPVERAIMDFAERVARDATSVTHDDVQTLRDLGLTDQDVFDIAAATAARCFFSTLLDALGAQADSAYAEQFDAALLEQLTVGRGVSTEDVERL